MYDGEGFGITFHIEDYTRPAEIEAIQSAKGSNTDDKPQEEGSRSADLQRDVDGKAKEIKGPKPKKGSNHNATPNEIK
jgi:hypothetical protein